MAQLGRPGLPASDRLECLFGVGKTAERKGLTFFVRRSVTFRRKRMYTAMTLFALAAFMGGTTPTKSPDWQTDYGTARRQGRSEKKPLAVFVGSGPHGYVNVSKDGKLNKEVRDLLARKYVCLYVDSATKAGRRLADVFELGSRPGLVISDRSGELQALRHVGKLSDRQLTQHLQRFAAPDYTVRTTVTNVAVRVSNYSPPPAAPPAY